MERAAGVAAARRGDGIASSAAFLCLAGLAAVLGAHAWLLPAGRWFADEYIQAAYARDFGLAYLLERLAGVSPRPVSELVLFAYYRIVAIAGRPLVEPFLLLHWIVLAASCFASRRQGAGVCGGVWRALAGTALLAMFVLGHQVAELFYWPAAAAPYLTTLAAATLFLFLMLDGRDGTPEGLAFSSCCLLVAACASEAGAMFAGACAALRLVLALHDRPGRRMAALLCWSLVLAAALAVLAAIALSSRIATEYAGLATPTYHRMGASLLAALPQLGRELAGLDMYGFSARAAAAGTAVKLVFFLGFRLTWRRVGAAQVRTASLAAFVMALLLGAWGTLAAGYFQYGGLCCERHGALRQCWFILALAALAAWPSRPTRLWGRMAAGWIGPVFLAVAALLPLATGRAAGLVRDYGLIGASGQAIRATWQSGFGAGPTMTYVPPPQGAVIHGANLPPGRYRAGAKPPWWAEGVLRFFRKDEVDIRRSE